MAKQQLIWRGILYIPEDRKKGRKLKCSPRGGRGLNIPLSYLVKGIKASPANTVGIPMTMPEKVAFPPKYSAYLLDEETTIKNDNYVGGSRQW